LTSMHRGDILPATLMGFPLSSATRIFRFGLFEADLKAGELRKGGVRVRLPDRSFRILALLLASAVALVAVRGAGRVLVGLLAAVAGGVLVWSGLRTLTGRLASGVAALSSVGASPGAVVTTSLHPVWPVLAVLAGVLGVAAGLLTEVQLADALEEQTRTGQRLGEIIVRLGFIFEDELARVLAEQVGISFVGAILFRFAVESGHKSRFGNGSSE